MRESKVERHLVREVERVGGKAYKWASPGRRGVPDRLVLLPGCRPFAVELKAPGKRPTLLQAKVHAELRALGLPVLIVDRVEAVNVALWAVSRDVLA